MHFVLQNPKSRIDGYQGWFLLLNFMFGLWKIFQNIEEVRFLQKHTETTFLLFT